MRKPCFAVAAALTSGAIGLAALLAGVLPATAASTAKTASIAKAASTARTQGSQSLVSVAITGMTPQWATARSTITVTGTVSNASTAPITDLSVQLDAAGSPLSSASALETYLGSPYLLGGNPVSGRRLISSALRPGQSARWTISFRAKAAGLTSFGVYPLTAQVNADVGAVGPTLDYAYTFLPYVPARHSRYAKSIPARKQVAWVWPLIDKPLIGLPDVRPCSGLQVGALHASLAPGGRLYNLLAAGASYAQQDQLTWVVDPALVEDARAVSNCVRAPGTAKAADEWLDTFGATTKSEPMFTTPYADVELSLIEQGHSKDVQRAFSFGRALAGQVLHRSFGPAGGSAPAATGSPITTVAWPPSGTADNSTLGTLAAQDNIQTLLISDGSAAAGSPNAFVTNIDVGGTAHVLRYSAFLAAILGTSTNRPGAAFAAAQDYLAATALLAQSRTPGSIIVAPPRRWSPSGDVAQTVLAATARAPWLKPTQLSALEQHVTSHEMLPDKALNPEHFSRPVVHEFGVIDGLIGQISAIAADQHFYLASTALQSSAWHSLSRSAQLAQIGPLARYMRQQQQGVSLVVATRVTLGGLKGNVPVLIDNRLDYPVTVRLSLHWRQPPGGGLKVTPAVTNPITVPARGQEPVKIRVEASQVGSTTLTVRLLNPSRQPLPTDSAVASVTVQATQFGNIAMIILASVLGVFVIASAIRGARRRDTPPPDDSGGGRLDPDAEGASQEGPQPDTVVPERSELGTAGTSGL